jgi:molybdenum cofactor biosynthesis enzyme MoaA
MVLKTIERALELGISPVKLNCVVIKNLNESEVLDFVELTREKAIEVRFIEFMPFDGISFQVRSDERKSMGNEQDRVLQSTPRKDQRQTLEHRTSTSVTWRNVTYLSLTRNT